MKRKIVVLALVAIGFFLSPTEFSDADCLAGYYYGADLGTCVECKRLSPEEAQCLETFDDAHCNCSQFGSSCVSGGGNCSYVFFWYF